jgi:hypothetical protein
MTYEHRFLMALAVTCLMETAVLFAVVRRGFRIDASVLGSGILAFSGVFASFATLPYLWFVLPAFISRYLVLSVVGELLVVAVEAVMYCFFLRLGARRALLLSFVCNAVSYGLGLVVFS